MQKSSHTADIWDVVVIGGGPAGMMAAGRAAQEGARVLLLEKNDILGKKLLITGGGRCNITNAEFDNRKLLAKFKESDKYLFSPFSEWSVQETLDFFHAHKLDTKEEAEQRVFPITEKALSVQQTLIEYLRQGNVTVRSHAEVKRFSISNSDSTQIKAVELKGEAKEKIYGKTFILATGGRSRPETGSTGDGFGWLKELGHTVIDPTPSLVPVTIKDTWVKELSGVTLQDIKLTVFQHGIKQDIKQSSKKGKILFTHFGITGPTVLNLSRDIGELLKYGPVELQLDLLPTYDYGTLNEKLQEIFKSNNSKKLKNSLDDLILSSLVPTVMQFSNIDEDTFCHSVSREQRLTLIKVLKGLPMNVSGLLGADKAIITSGGVSLDEVDFKTLQSRLFPNLYIIGDLLNIDRPSGGYSLQLCWTTGQVAGKSASMMRGA